MNKNYILLFLFIISFSSLQAQDEAPTSVVKHQFKINLLLPGFVYEHGFNAKNTLYSEASLGFGFQANSNNSNFAIFLAFFHQNGKFKHS